MIYRTIEIPIKGLFNEQECLWFLSRGYDDCLYRVYPDRVRRAFQSGTEQMLVDIYPLPDRLVVNWLTAEPSEQGEDHIRDFLNGWFDLEIELEVFYQKLSFYPELAYMTTQFRGLRFMGMPDLFEAFAWSIIGQQINLPFAYKIKRRLVEHYGSLIDYQGDRHYLFPSPESVAGASINDLKVMQLSGRKIEYLMTMASEITDHKLSKKILYALPDFAGRLKYLTSLRGIGQWTANYVLMKSLKERSSIPHGDAGLLNTLLRHHIITDKNDGAAIEELFRGFSGWESYLVFYLWRSLAPDPNSQ
ncbi:DNA-3-methyladenine glycosylase [Pedobacter sp. L105]|uniref:DNA-3-methyladenine glycosylase family protein n=1 Tax=Pedobacter sp. L105 TaxID=1641871 RepID=UPI00131E80C5|nr:DNA glycosylase [Pedobacter sp. L105]